MTRTVHELERDLRAAGTSVLEPDRLAEIRRRGGRRRRGRRTAARAGALAVVVVVGTLAVGWRAGVVPEPAPATPSESLQSPAQEPRVMSDEARRALAKIPGATRMSNWQVVLPSPSASAVLQETIPDDRVVSPRFDTGARSYLDPTMFEPGTFPAWLDQPDTGVLVDHGAAQLACVLPRPGNGEFPEDVCRATVLTVADGATVLRVSLGTDRFLQTGAPVEVFLEDDFSTGRPTQLAIAGLDGTRVARADFISSDGTVTEGTVLAGTLVEGDTMLFANVPGELASVIAYDADDGVVENHRLRDCDGPVDCEVR